MRVHRILASFVLMLADSALPARDAGATVPADLCTGNPCVVSGAKLVDAGATLNFGASTDLRFDASAVLTMTGGGGASFTARSIVVAPGARIDAPNDQCAEVQLTATAGDVDMQVAGPLTAVIEGTQGACPANVLLRATGNVNAGRMILHGHYGQYGFGGALRIEAGGFARVQGELRLGSDGTMSGGGQVAIEAGTGIAIDAPIYGVAGIEGMGLDLVTLAGDVTIGARIDVTGGADGGGFVRIEAPGGNVVLGGEFIGLSKASSVYTSCGYGTFMTIQAGQSVTLAGPMNLSSTGGTSCRGGGFHVSAGTTFVQTDDGDFVSQGLGAYGSGGEFDVMADGDVTLRDVTVGTGGSVNARSRGGAVRVLGKLRGLETGLQGCDVFVAAAASVDMRAGSNFGNGGGAGIAASETMTIAGKVLGVSGNTLSLREGEPLVTGVVLPAPTVTLLPSLPDCRPGPGCASGGTCGDGDVQCGEQCDAGPANGSVGSRCTSSCTELPPALRIPGGGAKPLDCPFEWSADLGTIMTDGTGLPAIKQSCTDNDPACDSDPAVGRCGLRLWGCAGAADARIGCAAATVTSTVATAPKTNARFPFEADARQAFDAALVTFGGSVGPGEVCTERFDVALAAGGRPLKLQVKATLASGKKDQDKLELRCVP
jgi:hypothetical protein